MRVDLRMAEGSTAVASVATYGEAVSSRSAPNSSGPMIRSHHLRYDDAQREEGDDDGDEDEVSHDGYSSGGVDRWHRAR